MKMINLTENILFALTQIFISLIVALTIGYSYM